jgi:chromatin segregation and condensation protein Rec8/ScpA/Scc1 (kleisin family)
MLHQRELIENAAWSNPGSVDVEESELEPELAVSLYDLLLAFRDVTTRAEERPMIEERISSVRGSVGLTDVLPQISSRRGLITAFLALLELTRLKAIFLKQDKAFGEIIARANPNYELSKSYSPA